MKPSVSPRSLPRQAPPMLESAAQCLVAASGFPTCHFFMLDAEGALVPLLPAGAPVAASAMGTLAAADVPVLPAVLSGEVLAFDTSEIALGSRFREWLDAWSACCGVAFALAVEHGAPVGVGVLLSPVPHGLDDARREVVRPFSRMMGRLLLDRYHSLRLQLQQREQELSTLYALTAAAVESRNLDHLLDRALGSILEVTRLGGGLLLFREADSPRAFWAASGLPDELLAVTESFEASHGMLALYRCLAGAEPGEQDAPSKRLRRRYKEALSTWVVLPLHSQGRFSGMLLLGSADYSQLSDELSQLLWTITHQLILAIERSQAYLSLEAQVEKRTHELTESHRQLMETVAELKRMDQYKTDFLSNVSHELRTPLSGIIGYGEFLTEEVYGPLNPEQRHVLDQLVDNGYRLMELINNLLDLSRIDAGKLRLYLEPIELGTLFDQSIGQVRPVAMQKQLAIIEPEGPTPLVEVDPSRVVQVLVNLLSNAIKFTEPGGTVTITYTLGKDVVRVEVTDTGIGIPADHVPKLFERFSQGDSSTTRRYGGTGLGLAISRELIELHGQQIGVTSEPGVGSRFYFSLPVWRQEGESASKIG